MGYRRPTLSPDVVARPNTGYKLGIVMSPVRSPGDDPERSRGLEYLATREQMMAYPLAMSKSLLKITIEIVDCPINSMIAW